MSKLLSDHIRDLKLNPHAPYPWQVLNDKAERESKVKEIREWRERQRLSVVAPNGETRERRVTT